MKVLLTALPASTELGLLVVVGLFIALGLMALWATKGKFK